MNIASNPKETLFCFYSCFVYYHLLFHKLLAIPILFHSLSSPCPLRSLFSQSHASQLWLGITSAIVVQQTIEHLATRVEHLLEGIKTNQKTTAGSRPPPELILRAEQALTEANVVVNGQLASQLSGLSYVNRSQSGPLPEASSSLAHQMQVKEHH
ncbi:unnamed protein product [Protopolystoma xenopodis]|uniref:Uncharacterized protein n=1 Tax=Protopolystoma xenopodis TaxID=117903 RepID=A0A3S4ZV41_9PLAT|nr:unnamed protein product [Protopolystoma xenopodis]